MKKKDLFLLYYEGFIDIFLYWSSSKSILSQCSEFRRS